MSLKDRRIALVCMTPQSDGNEHGQATLPSYGVRRILAALVADPDLSECRYALVDFERADLSAYVNALIGFEPALIGFSAYVWSLPFLVDVAREVKRHLPHCVIVFGGPSARVAMFDLPPYARPYEFLDAVVPAEGEITFREIASLPVLGRAQLEHIAGLALPTTAGWLHTAPRVNLRDLDVIASPYQIGLMGAAPVSYLETFRGCPFSCAFCEWGTATGVGGLFSADYLTREMEAHARLGVPAVFLVDAGLNLNAQGFRNLKTAESRVGLLKTAALWSEVYPSHLTDEHLDFLGSVRASYLGIGLQSVDDALLKGLGRPFNPARFESVVKDVARLANAEVQIIFGLPGDNPEGFLRTLNYARSLPVAVRAYHGLVLPDALMTRSKPEWQIRFDPVTLEMQSCLGWSPEQLQSMRLRLTEWTRACGGSSGQYWWSFPRTH